MFFLCVPSRSVWSLRSKCPLWLFLIDVVNVAHLATLLGAFRITWACAQAAIVCVFQLTPLVRTKKNNACQLGSAVLTRCPGFCLFVWVVFFFFLLPLLYPSPNPPPTVPNLKRLARKELKKESCASLSVPQMRLRGKPPRSIVEVWRRFWAASLHPRPQRWPTKQALPAWWSHI